MGLDLEGGGGRVQGWKREEVTRGEEGLEWGDGWEYLMEECKRGLGRGLKVF